MPILTLFGSVNNFTSGDLKGSTNYSGFVEVPSEGFEAVGGLRCWLTGVFSLMSTFYFLAGLFGLIVMLIEAA